MEPLATPNNTVMGTIIGGKFFDDAAVQFNGVDQAAYRDNPSFRNDNSGAMAFDVTALRIAGGNSTEQVICMRGSGGASCNVSIVQRSSFGDTDARIMIYLNSGVWMAACDTTRITINTKYRVVFNSDGTAYINGVPQSFVRDTGSAWTGQWYGSFADATKRFAMGANWVPGAGSPVGCGNIRLNNVVYYSAPLTAAEALLDYNGGVSFDRRSNAGLAAKLVEFWRFDGNGNAEINPANNLTPYGTPTYAAP